MKTIGIIGGLGPETTSHFYLDIIDMCRKQGIKKRPRILIWNVPLSYSTEEKFITKVGGISEYRKLLIEGAKILKNGGADFIVIPCNSVHILIDDVRKSVSIPVFSIIEETANFLINKRIKNIGLLATTPTIKTRLYQNILENKLFKVYIPNKEKQMIMDDLIQKLAQSESVSDGLKTITQVSELLINQGATAILMACTDLQLIVNNNIGFKTFDTEKILVQSVVKYIMKP